MATEARRFAVRSPRLWAGAALVAVILATAAYQLVAGWRLATRPEDFLSARAPGALASYATAVGAFALWTMLAPRKLLVVAPLLSWVGAIVVLGLVAVRGGQAGSIGMAVATLIAAWNVGDVLLGGPLRGARLATTPGVALALGYSVLASLILVVGLGGALHEATIWPGITVLVVGGVVRGVRRRESVRGWRASADSRAVCFAAAAIGATAAFGALWAAAPETQFDALHYKAWLPEVWAADGRIRFPLIHPVGSMFGSTYLVPIPGHVMQSPAVGRWLQYMLALGICVVVARYLASSASSTYAALAAIAVLATPHVMWQMSTAYDDLALCLLVLGLALAVLCADQDERGSSVVIGLLAGGAWSGKAHLAPFAVAAVLVWAWAGGRSRRWRRAADLALGAVLSAGPLTIARWVATGNPVFPQFNNIFRSRYFPPVNPTFNLPYDDGGFGALMRLPFVVATAPSRFMEGGPPGAFGLLLVPALAAPALAWWGSERARMLTLPCAAALLFWWIQMRYLRYMLPYSVVGVVVAGPLLSTSLAGLARGRSKWKSRLAVGAIGVWLVATFPSTLASFWNIAERLPYRVALGAESVADYQHRTIRASRATDAINQYLEPGDHVVGAVAYPRTLIDPGIEMSTEDEFLLRMSLQWATRSTDPETILERWRETGATHIAIDARRRAASAELDPDIGLLLEHHGELLWAGTYIELYRLVDQPAARADVHVCDSKFTGDGACWGTQLDGTAGLTIAEASRSARQGVEVCVARTYEVDVEVDGVDGGVTLTVQTDGADGLIGWERVEVPAGSNGSLALTAEEGATRLVLSLLPTGSARVLDVRVTVDSPSSACS